MLFVGDLGGFKQEAGEGHGTGYRGQFAGGEHVARWPGDGGAGLGGVEAVEEVMVGGEDLQEGIAIGGGLELDGVGDEMAFGRRDGNADGAGEEGGDGVLGGGDGGYVGELVGAVADVQGVEMGEGGLEAALGVVAPEEAERQQEEDGQDEPIDGSPGGTAESDAGAAAHNGSITQNGLSGF